MPTPPRPNPLASADTYFVHDKDGKVFGWNVTKKVALSLVDELKREGSRTGRPKLRAVSADKITDQVRAAHPHLMDAESFAFGVAELAKAVPMPGTTLSPTRAAADDVSKAMAEAGAELGDLPELGLAEGELSDEEIAAMEANAEQAVADTRAPTVPGAPSSELVAESTPARATTTPGPAVPPQPAPVPGRVVNATGRIDVYPQPSAAAAPAPAALAPDAPADEPVPTVEDVLDDDDDELSGLRM